MIARRCHKPASNDGIHIAKIKIEPARSRPSAALMKPSVLNTCCNLVMNYRLVVLSHDVDAELQNVLGTQFVRFAVPILLGESHSVDKGAIGRLHVTNPHATRAFLSPDLGVLP